MFGSKPAAAKPARRLSMARGPAPSAGQRPGGGTGSNQALQRHLRKPDAQPGLRLGGIRHPDEADADHIAVRVMRDPEGKAPHPRLDLSGASRTATLGSGRSLDRHIQTRLAPHFDGLSAVRIHDDREAAGAARSIRARAFATGGDIAFAAGAYAPGTPDGLRLLVHELAHVAQGGDAIRRQPDDEAEEEPVARTRQPGLLSLDYGGPDVCGGKPCFDEQSFLDGMKQEAAADAFEAESIENATPLGVVGAFIVAAGTAKAPPPPKVQPPGMPRVVQGSTDTLAASSTMEMGLRTGHQAVGLGEGALAGINEATLIAHGTPHAVDIGPHSWAPRQLAEKLVEAGWRGGVLRMVSCKTGLCAAGTSYAQQLANELAALGAETVVIAPKHRVGTLGDVHGIPQVENAKRGTPGQRNFLPPGEGWEYFAAEDKPGWQLDRSPAKPGAWKGAAVGGAKFSGMIALSYLHSKAVAKRAQEEAAKTGFSDWGPTGSVGYDLGAWLLDPSDEAGRSVPFSARFAMSAWRQTMKDAADRKKPGDYYENSWTTQDGEDSFGTPYYRRYYAKYRKGANGYWYTIACEDCEGDDFPPDLNKIIDPLVSDEEIRIYLELPLPWTDQA